MWPRTAVAWRAASSLPGSGSGSRARACRFPRRSRPAWLRACVGLGGLALLLTRVAWNGWPDAAAAPTGPRVSRRAHGPSQQAEERGGSRAVQSRHRASPLTALYVAYGLNAVGLVPHMVFLVDFV